jgi:ABC-type multidrug transport system permease subunit
VLDEDRSFLSQSFRQDLERQGFVLRDLTRADIDSARTGPRYVRIPAGFQDSVAAARQVPVHFQTRPGADEEFSVTARMHVQRAILATISNLVLATAGSATGEPAAGASSPGAGAAPAPLVFDERFQAAYREVAARPGLITIAAETAGRGRAVPAGMGHSLPATITLFMLINTAIYGAVILAEEKQNQILGRIATFPISRRRILAGKLIGRALLGLMQAAVLLLAGRWIFGVYLGRSLPALILVTGCLALAVAALALFWGAVVRRVEQATALVLVVSLFLGAIGGCWWPLEVVPSWMQAAGHISPAAWAMDGFHTVLSFGAGIEAVAVPCLVLLGYAVLFTLLGARLLRFTS